MFFIGLGPQCFFMFTSSSTLSYFFRTFSQHGIRTFAVLAYHWKKVCILTCPVTDVTVYCTICWFAPNLLHNFKTAGWLKLGHVLANKGAALGISGRQKSPKIQQEQGYEIVRFAGLQRSYLSLPMMSLAVFWLRTRCIVSLEGFPTSGIPSSNRVVHPGKTHTQSARLALHIDPTIAILRSAARSEDRSSERSSDSMPSFADCSDYYPYNARPPR